MKNINTISYNHYIPLTRSFAGFLFVGLLIGAIAPSTEIFAGRLKEGTSNDLRFEELSRRVPAEKLDELVDRFGAATVPATVIEEARKRLMSGALKFGDRETIDKAVSELSKIEMRKRSPKERERLSRAWAEAARLARKLDGPTQRSVDYLEIAYALDPDNQDLANEVKFQRDRKRIIEARLAEAKRIREAQAKGEDPDSSVPYVGDPSLGSETNR